MQTEKRFPARPSTAAAAVWIEGELYYMPGTDPVSMAGAKDKVVLFDTQGIGFFAYQDLMKAGAKATCFSMEMLIIQTTISIRETSERW